MYISTLPQQTTINQYQADGTNATFSYNFLIQLNADMNVYVTLPNHNANPDIDFVPQSQYTISGVGNTTGGSITFAVAPVSGAVVTILRNMQMSISTAFSNAQMFNGANLDAAFQRVVLLIQQMQGNAAVNASQVNPNVVNGAISRCLQYEIDSYLPTPAPTTLPSLTTLNGAPTDGLVWVGQGGGIAVTQLFTGGDANALQTLLASKTPGADGASLIGYYDNATNTPTTVDTWLQGMPAKQQQSGLAISADDTGLVNALVVTLFPALSSYAKYGRLYVKAANTNTSASTINVNGLGTKAITYMDGSALNTGAIQAGEILALDYDGTQYQLLNPLVRPATNAEALGGTDAIHPLTSAAVASGLTSIGTNASGYAKLPGGLIIQWGTVAGTIGSGTGNTFVFTFPIIFPNALLSYSLTFTSFSLPPVLIQYVVTAFNSSTLTFQMDTAAVGKSFTMQLSLIGH